MSGVADLQSGKGHKNENFPVASFLIAPQNRPPVLAFYNFVRAADDVADHASAPAEEKLRLLEEMRASLTGESDAVPEGVRLRTVLKERGLSPVHALDLLEAQWLTGRVDRDDLTIEDDRRVQLRGELCQREDDLGKLRMLLAPVARIDRHSPRLLGVAAYAAPVLSTLLLVATGFAPLTASLGLACAAIVGGAYVAAR